MPFVLDDGAAGWNRALLVLSRKGDRAHFTIGSARRTTAGSGSMQFLGPPRYQRLSNSRLLPQQ
jgi:hypothetical protein